MMNSQALGKNISEVKVTNISNNGIWLLAGDKELFMSYEKFPSFLTHRLPQYDLPDLRGRRRLHRFFCL
ncbi:MAG: hypothetical protein U9R02_02240 [Thermodesulfobacteriota bacterium]|nr:hypothetical protein [Thermodesulfobacteriota bacterium]